MARRAVTWYVNGRPVASARVAFDTAGKEIAEEVDRYFREFLKKLALAIKRELGRASPRKTGKLARGWRVTSTFRGLKKGGSIFITNVSANAYWPVLNYGKRSKHRGFVLRAIDVAIARTQ